MKPPGTDLPIVATKWYSYAKWVLERVENFPKSQRFILGQRLANEGIEMTRWVVRMDHDRNPLAPKKCEFSAVTLNECGRMVGGRQRSFGAEHPRQGP